MSSFDGSATTTDSPSSELQIAPTGAKGPAFGDLKQGFERCISDSQGFVDQCRANFLVRYALWNGQSADGKKHARGAGGVTEVIPWDGASDLRVYLNDEAINAKVALYCSAFNRANLVAVPIMGNDFKRAKLVTEFMRWQIHTQMPELDREIELLAQYINEKGVAATGQFWETKQEKVLATVTVQQLQQQMPDLDVMAILVDPAASEMLADVFERTYGCTEAKSKKMIRELAEKQTTTVATRGREISRPVLRAFNLDEQLFIPPETTDIERAPAIYRVEYYYPEALRAFTESAGWDKDWVEAAISKCRGQLITLTPSEYQQPISRSFIYQQQTLNNKEQIGVVYAYQRLSDEDGVPGIYLTIFNPGLPNDESHDGYAKFGLLEYAHGEYPFKLYRREYLSRRLHDSRGIPEPGKSFQEAIKAHMDSRIDAASIAIIPPLGYPAGRPPTKWGPGARIPERRPNENHFLDRPVVDGLTETSQEILTEKFKAYCGFLTKDGDPQYAQMKSQHEVTKFLKSLSSALDQCFSLYQQYGDDKVTFRVLGMRDATAVEFIKGDPTERYHWYLSFDTQSGDMEKQKEKWKAIIEGIQMLNREGNVSFSRAIQAYFESIDPSLAEQILEPTEVARDRVIKEEQDDLAKIFAGFNINVKPNTPPDLAMQTLQNWVQGAPDVQNKLQVDQAFRERLEARMKQHQQNKVQYQDNVEVGKLGALMPGEVMK